MLMVPVGSQSNLNNMKYLKEYKLFESSDLPYVEITRDEYNYETIGEGNPNYEIYDNDFEEYTYDGSEFISDNWVAFTQNELSKIQELVPDAHFSKTIKTDPDDIRIDSKESGIIMIKLKDEWYYVMMDMSDQAQDDLFFKCDQFEGLIKLIQDYIV